MSGQPRRRRRAGALLRSSSSVRVLRARARAKPLTKTQTRLDLLRVPATVHSKGRRRARNADRCRSPLESWRQPAVAPATASASAPPAAASITTAPSAPACCTRSRMRCCKRQTRCSLQIPRLASSRRRRRRPPMSRAWTPDNPPSRRLSSRYSRYSRCSDALPSLLRMNAMYCAGLHATITATSSLTRVYWYSTDSARAHETSRRYDGARQDADVGPGTRTQKKREPAEPVRNKAYGVLKELLRAPPPRPACGRRRSS